MLNYHGIEAESSILPEPIDNIYYDTTREEVLIIINELTNHVEEEILNNRFECECILHELISFTDTTYKGIEFGSFGLPVRYTIDLSRRKNSSSIGGSGVEIGDSKFGVKVVDNLNEIINSDSYNDYIDAPPQQLPPPIPPLPQLQSINIAWDDVKIVGRVLYMLVDTVGDLMNDNQSLSVESIESIDSVLGKYNYHYYYYYYYHYC